MYDFLNTLTAVVEGLQQLAASIDQILDNQVCCEPLTIKGFCQRYPEISENTLRHWIRTNQSGFDKVYKKVGKSIYIDNAAFVDWFKGL